MPTDEVLSAESVAELRHELRTPVNVITGYSEMLLEDAASGNGTGVDGDAQLAEPLSFLGDEMREILRLISATLPSSATPVPRASLDGLRVALTARQTRVLELLAQASAAPSAQQPDVADDLRRMTTAAGRLADFSGHASEMSSIAADIAATPVRARADAIAPASVLVVDDIEDNRAVLSRRLERLGHRVACVENGAEALARSAAEPFDLILLDVMMPVLDGFSTLLQLKARPSTCDVPVIMISALDDMSSTARCIAQGAEDYLAKPFDALLLQARVGASLERKRLRDREQDFLTQTMRVVDAARAVEEGCYDSGVLGEIGRRSDELGRLARVFDGMAAEVAAREERLQQQLRDLRYEIDTVRAATMTGTYPIAVAPASHTDASHSDTSGPDTPLQVGRRVGGRYQIFEVAGEGGMGRVFRATDLELGGDVAIKSLRQDVLDNDPALLEWLKSEIRLSRRITHPNVVRTHDYGEADGFTFITMEYVPGVSLRGMLEARGRLTPSACLSLGAQLFRALQAAHDQGVVHRDVKPDNVLLSTTGVLKVMDFGIARLLDGGDGAAEDGAGTLGYMAPEQLLDEPVDSRADLYAAGALLFECLTGRLPYEAPTAMSLIPRILTGPPPQASEWNADVSPAFSALLASLLAADPADRPASARHVEVALEGLH